MLHIPLYIIYIYIICHIYFKWFGRLYVRNNGYDFPIVLSLYALHDETRTTRKIVDQNINTYDRYDK
jgi:hypothetical protein